MGPFAVTSCDKLKPLQRCSAHDGVMAGELTHLPAQLTLLHHLAGCSLLQAAVPGTSEVSHQTTTTKLLLTQRCSCCRCFRCARRTLVTSTP